MKHARLIHRGMETRIALEVADGSIERMRGLLGRSRLDADRALWLEPCNAVHTFGMRFPIDVVFIDKGGRVLAVHRNVSRARVLVCWRARSVLEMRAHAAQAWCVDVRDSLEWRASS
ncbi:DUF192 domain-containing protein [Paraburkholderia azotifigens]|uniref:DUF192 domain-containing protein n=1 Tax=Paraburkholderia azotifigens TaxID=2057004 RepID=A0A5C6VJM3_9BURK|nr:DUF192 domain-containing protein [Paraburkholderia azotifigens]TXC83438.1 DUF192 domain-containing protein [Paraburkholderia azotifigens]